MKQLAKSILLLSIPAAALAEPTWVEVATSTTGAIWSVDASSIKEISEGYPSRKIRKAWTRIDYSKDKTNAAREAKVLRFFDCNEETHKSSTWVEYNSDGTVLNDMSSSYSAYRPVIPGSVLSGTMEVVCGVNLSAGY